MPCYTREEMIDLVVEAYQDGITRKSAEILMIRGMSPLPPGRKNILQKDGHLFARDIRLKASDLIQVKSQFRVVSFCIMHLV